MKIALFSTHEVPLFLKEYLKDGTGRVDMEKRSELAKLLEAGKWQNYEDDLPEYSTDIADYLRFNRDRICCHADCYYFYKPRVSKYQVPYMWIVDVHTDVPWTIYSPEYGPDTEWILYFNEQKNNYYAIEEKER